MYLVSMWNICSLSGLSFCKIFPTKVAAEKDQSILKLFTLWIIQSWLIWKTFHDSNDSSKINPEWWLQNYSIIFYKNYSTDKALNNKSKSWTNRISSFSINLFKYIGNDVIHFLIKNHRHFQNFWVESLVHMSKKVLFDKKVKIECVFHPKNELRSSFSSWRWNTICILNMCLNPLDLYIRKP